MKQQDEARMKWVGQWAEKRHLFQTLQPRPAIAPDQKSQQNAPAVS
ncbi:MAG: hypothetical protein HC833_15115 [Leptolyngbyaceae cyanobacterium RM1_406_9]|nr:hypothetical protein [Leptolyngbyaceae cyanobacterium RM1_406_9]